VFGAKDNKCVLLFAFYHVHRTFLTDGRSSSKGLK
jgi:hypothetical protein